MRRRRPRWHREPSAPPWTDVEHRDGVWWFAAPLPRHPHRCTPWSRGSLGAHYLERCACGALRVDLDGDWTDRYCRPGAR